MESSLACLNQFIHHRNPKIVWKSKIASVLSIWVRKKPRNMLKHHRSNVIIILSIKWILLRFIQLQLFIQPVLLFFNKARYKTSIKKVLRVYDNKKYTTSPKWEIIITKWWTIPGKGRNNLSKIKLNNNNKLSKLHAYSLAYLKVQENNI